MDEGCWGCCRDAGAAVVRFRRDDEAVGFDEFGNGFGALNLVSNLATFGWLDDLVCPGRNEEDEELEAGTLLFPLSSSAAICRVTEFIEEVAMINPVLHRSFVSTL